MVWCPCLRPEIAAYSTCRCHSLIPSHDGPKFESEGATLGARTIYFFFGESRVGQTLDAMCQPHGCGRGGRPAHLWHSVLTNLCRWKALPIWALESINRQRWIEMLPGFPDFMIESIGKILLHRHVLMLAVLHIHSVDVVSFSLCRKTGPPTRATQLNFSAAALTLGSHTGSKQKLEIRKQLKQTTEHETGLATTECNKYLFIPCRVGSGYGHVA